MAYRDPYSSQYPGGAQGYQPEHSYSYPQQGSSQGYSNNAAYPQRQPTYDGGAQDDGGFNPYERQEPGKPRRADEEEEYTYGGAYDYPPQRQQTQKSTFSGRTRPSVRSNKNAGFEQSVFTQLAAVAPRTKTARALREYRYDHQGNLWTKGSRGRCIGRFCGCSLMTFVVLLVCVVMALALYVRPPSIKIGSVIVMNGENGSPIQNLANGLTVELGVPIGVQNPNYFAVDFNQIKAEIFYPIDNTPLGGGTVKGIHIAKDAPTNFTFPFALNYNPTLDPQLKVISDIGSKCGVNGPKTNLVVNYKITLGIRLLFVTISPVISNQFSFPCPLSPSDIQRFLGSSIGL